MTIENNAAAFLKALDAATDAALERIGETVERYARAGAVEPARPAGEIRDSLAHEVSGGAVRVGSNLAVAAYVELGTGPLYDPPPEWLQNDAPGGKGQAGLERWLYFDEAEGKVRVGVPQPARPFLRPAVVEHMDEFREIVQRELENG